MKSTPPPPVDRMQRQVNPLALAILIVCLAGALLAFYLAPNAAGATLMTWMIVILAVCGAFGLSRRQTLCAVRLFRQKVEH